MSVKTKIISLKYYFLFLLMLFAIVPSGMFAKGGISEADKIVFVYLNNRSKNFIVIPNFRGKLHTFKIYRKLKSGNEFSFIVEIRKPKIPLRSNRPGPYSVQWEDPEYLSRNVDYRIIGYDKKGQDYGEMNFIWEEEK